MGKSVDIDGHLTIDDGSVLTIKDDSAIKILPDSEIFIKGTEDHPLYIRQVQNIAPVAVHIKEVNHIDPVSIDRGPVRQ